MTVLALASDVNSIGLLIPWASTFAKARSTSLTVLCWTHSPVENAMIGCGLSFAQANPQLGRTAMKTVVGLCCTLAISLAIGLVTPGSELTPQIHARGKPTVLDLIVAIASAAAAAYALARPSLVGSIAGVAIATALVPPLCSVGAQRGNSILTSPMSWSRL